jgi:hypothetical protein
MKFPGMPQIWSGSFSVINSILTITARIVGWMAPFQCALRRWPSIRTIFVGSAIVAVCLNCLWQLELAIRHGQVAIIQGSGRADLKKYDAKSVHNDPVY